MKRATIITTLCLMLSASAMAQNASQSLSANGGGMKAGDALPSVEQILDKYLQVIGGKAAIEKVTSRYAKGIFTIPAAGLSGQMESYRKAPGKRMVSVSIENMGTARNGFDGTVAWEQDPESGKLSEKAGKELAAIKRDADFYRDIKLREIYPQMTVKGKDKAAGREVYVIEATTADGTTDKLYFDTETGLLLRRDSKEVTEKGETPVREVYSDYKEVDGIKLPFSIRRASPAMTYTIQVTEVKQNITIDDAKFKEPATR